MKCLLDTHAFIWLITEDSKLSDTARDCILDSRTSLYLSTASIWEIIIKCNIGKLKLPGNPQEFISKQLLINLIEELAITFDHAFHLLQLPDHHKDPFDRMLVAQALSEKLTIMTIDPIIARYSVRTIW
jgi:PIN domain nuclease of toxin-antitoxin system